MAEYPEELFKHKGVVVALGALGLIVIIMLLRGGKSSASPASSLINAQLAQNQLDAQASVANGQASSQQYMAQLQAQETEAQYKAAEDAANQQTYAQLIGELANTQTEGKYIDTAGKVAIAQNGTMQHEFDTAYNDYTDVTNNQINARAQENNMILGAVKQAGLNHGTTQLEQSLEGIVGEVLNQPQVGVAATQSNAYISGSNNSMWASIVNSLSSAASNIFA